MFINAGQGRRKYNFTITLKLLIVKSDVIFLPYPRSFQYRTSGVLLEALSNHKKALVSDTSYFRQYQNLSPSHHV